MLNILGGRLWEVQLHIITGLQITVGYWTLGDQNLFVPDKFSAVVGHDVQAISFHNYS